jgi:asparagine synthase (glutamine-hydrolysing)
MRHEPFYGVRTYTIPSIGCCVGVISHDETFADCQILESKDKSQIVFFAGEHFAHDESSKIEALFSTYHTYDDRFLRALNGWFAGVVVDLNKSRLVVFNDRFGIGRVYYTKTAESFAFASEAKSLLAVRPATRTFNQVALGQYLGVGAVLNDLTLFNDVLVMPGGSAWSVEASGRITKRRFFTPEELESQAPLSESDFSNALRETLARAIPSYFRGTSAVAVSLTGGLDTRGIMAFAPKSTARHAYTYRGMYREAFDVRIAREVAKICDYEYDVLPIGRRFLHEFPELAAKTIWITDGTLDIGASHEIYLSRLARQIAPVRITGNYGSEILRNVTTFKPLRLQSALFDGDFRPFIEEGERSLEDAKQCHPISFAAFKEIPWNLYGRLAAAQSQLTVRSPYTDNDVVSLAYRGPRDRRTQTHVWQRLIAAQNPLLAAIPTDRGLGGRGALKRHWQRLYRYAMFKAEWYYEAGMPSWMARLDSRFGRGRLPPWFTGSHKIENYRLWFRDELFEWIRDSLCESLVSCPYLDGKVVRRIASAHGAGTANVSTDLNRVLSVALIHKIFIDGRIQIGSRGAVFRPTQSSQIDSGSTRRDRSFALNSPN